MSPIRFNKIFNPSSLKCVEFNGYNPQIPPRIGGMATPLGVYMTTGKLTGGAGNQGLFAAGVVFAFVMHLSEQLFMVFYSALEVLLPWWGAWSLIHPMVATTTQLGFSLIFFLILIRYTAMGGLHGAEHKTINALEAGEMPAFDVLKTFPRQHARCGTNIGVLLFLVQWVFYSVWQLHPYISLWGLLIYLIAWVFIIKKFWKVLGYLLQTFFTTREPSDTELSSGQLAAEDLLAQYATDTHGKPTVWQKIWGMGLIQMSVAFMMIYSLLQWVISQIPWLL